MKKLLGIVVLGLLLSGNAYAADRLYDGPKTIEAAKAKFFKDRELDIIEGIWYQQSEGAMYAIVKKSYGLYNVWTVDHKVSKYNGTMDKTTSLRKTSSNKVYAYKTIIYNPKDTSEEAIGTGTWVLKNANYIDEVIIKGCYSLGRCWAPILSNYMRVWPENTSLQDNNKDPKKELTPKSGQLVSGSGFFINNKGYVVTNSHVIEGCKTDKKVSQDIISADFELVAEDKSLDLALLKTKFRNKDFLKLSKNEIGKLDRVIVAGYPLGKFLSDDLKFTEGIVSSLKGFQGASHEMQIDAAINSGNSGGPVVDEKGNLIGVAVATLSKELTEGINFAIKSSSVEMFLKSNAINIIKSGYSFGNFDRVKLRDLLEKSTVYISCKL